MQDNVMGSQCGCGTNFREAVCIHTDKIFDSCRDKDCLEDLRVYLTQQGQACVDSAISIKCSRAEIIWVFSDIESVQFNRGFYSIDLKYFFRVVLQVFTGMGRPVEIDGLATFSKKVILFGSDGNAKTFSSKYKQNAFDPQQWKKTNMPYSVVEVVEPIVLGSKLVDVRQNCCCNDEDFDITSVPDSVSQIFDEPLVVGGESKRAFVSLGIFSIIKLERRVQLLVPSYDYCVPQKQCSNSSGNDDRPCDLFDRIEFPMDEFYPPERRSFLEKGQQDPSVPVDEKGGECRHCAEAAKETAERNGRIVRRG